MTTAAVPAATATWLQNLLGRSPHRPGLFLAALTHRSATDDNNERLEFLGDAVLGMLIAEELYRRFPEADEGDLSRLRSRLVSAGPLAQIGLGLNIGSVLRHVDFVASDVPGVPVPVFLGGDRVSKQYAFGPTIGAAVNVTLLTYVNTCSLGIDVDTAALQETIALLRDSGTPHQLRTTRWPGLTRDDERAITEIALSSPHVWQDYRPPLPV